MSVPKTAAGNSLALNQRPHREVAEEIAILPRLEDGSMNIDVIEAMIEEACRDQYQRACSRFSDKFENVTMDMKSLVQFLKQHVSTHNPDILPVMTEETFKSLRTVCEADRGLLLFLIEHLNRDPWHDVGGNLLIMEDSEKAVREKLAIVSVMLESGEDRDAIEAFVKTGATK